MRDATPDPSLWRELASDLPAALRDFACIVLFGGGLPLLLLGVLT